MKQTITESEFIDSFGRMGRGNYFSYEGRRALFEFLTDYEDSTGEEIELDVISLCGDFEEYESALDAAEDYGWDTDDEETEAGALEFLRDNTTVINGDGFIIIQCW